MIDHIPHKFLCGQTVAHGRYNCFKLDDKL